MKTGSNFGMKAFSLKNLRATEVEPINLPCPNRVAPRPTFESKEEFRKWCAEPATNHVFYTHVEALTPGLRVTTENPAHMLHGFTADYDASVTDDMIANISKNSTIMPNWSSRTFSGGARLTWEFETPVLVDNPDLAERFLTLLAKELVVKNLLPGYDPASEKLNQVFEYGSGWKAFGAPGRTPIPTDRLSLVFFKAAGAKQIATSDFEIPLEKVATEVEKRWPGLWPGNFVEGARGPLFWVDPFEDRVGCQIGTHGMLCFSTRAGKSFLSWREVLGKEFVRNFEAACIGRAIDGIYFDSQSYWVKLESGIWASNRKEDMLADLKIRNHLKQPQAEEALSVIRNSHRITGTFPFLHNKNDLVRDESGSLFLNISTRKILQPAPEAGPFPWLKNWIENVWDDPVDIQRDTFLAWYQRAYETAFAGEMKAGQAIALAGGTGIGKTLIARKVIGKSLGGFADASNFLLEKTTFNKACIESSIWVVDDSFASSEWRDHESFSNAVKKFQANPQIEFHAKYRDAQMVTWRGRIIIGCNLDLKSLGIIPELDSSIQDKLMLFKLRETFTPDFKDIELVIERELPYFLQWLLNWNAPKTILGDERFGVKCYHHPEILDATNDAAPHGSLAGMLEYAVKHALHNDTKQKERWFTAVELRALLDTPGLRTSLARFAGNRLAIALSRLPNTYVKETRRVRGIKQFLINLEL